MKDISLSVIMLVYNAELYLNAAVYSVLNQTYRDFEFIIIDDASTDSSLNMLRDYTDSRITLLLNKENRGIVYSRNKGLKQASGKYIAMFDSDDIAYPTKFEKQVNFLDNHADYGMIGCWSKRINQDGTEITPPLRLNAPARDIPSILIFRNYFINSAVVFRSQMVEDFVYPKGYDIVEDYLMWDHISKKSKVWNLPEYLIEYRIHKKSVTNEKKEALKTVEIKVFNQFFNHLNIPNFLHDYHAHFLIKDDHKISAKEELNRVNKWLNFLYAKNKDKACYNQRSFSKILFNRWLKTIYKSKNMGVYSIIKFVNSRILWVYVSHLIRFR